jgi:hypothetical protein
MSYNTPEGKIKKKVTQLLKSYSVWYFMPVSNGFGKAGIPDYIACVSGTFIGVECKSDTKKNPTALQVKCGEGIKEAGGHWLVVCDDESLAKLKKLLEVAQGIH